jgi:pimeloyl-ACP methyl ester carboxylesterase
MTLVKRIRANGLDFAYLEQGHGPVALLLHGFPDNAHTWSHQMPALAAAGYRVVAPFMRGYSPTEVPSGGYFDKATLVADAAGLARAFGGGEPVHFVGYDWGAIVGYGLLSAFPDLVRRAVLMAVPHPEPVRRSMIDPRHVHRSFHWWFFQLPDLPEQALAANDFAFIDYFWEYWSTRGFRDDAHVAQVKSMLAQPGVLAATLAYYRAMLDPSKADPALAALRQSMELPIGVPTLALCGVDDMRAELMLDQGQYFIGQYRFKLVRGAGHFLHREQPALVTDLVLDWLAGR